jgi:uncharacterized protein YggE
MNKRIATIALTLVCLASPPLWAQQIKNTVVALSGYGEVRAENDLAHVTFFIEEQDKDKAAAANRVNTKIRRATEMLKKLDPDGKLANRDYYSNPEYPDNVPHNKQPTIVSWRVGQSLEWTTKNLLQLATTTAEIQQVLALNGLVFGLTDETQKKLEAQRIQAAYVNLQEKIQMIATAIGKNPADAIVESLNIDNAAPLMESPPPPASPRFLMQAKMPSPDRTIEATSFEPGETTVSATIVAKIRFN